MTLNDLPAQLREQIERQVLDTVISIGGKEITDLFHKLFYYSYRTTWRNTRWMGTQVFKCPFDLWVYQELITELSPDLIIECGTATGGSALYLAQICELNGHGEVVTIDIDPKPAGYHEDGFRFRPEHPRIRYLTGSSISSDVLDRVREIARDKHRVMVILDSNHERDHVLAELRLYQDLVTPGSYMIVEDSNRNGHPVEPDRGPGPMEAIETFLQETSEFESDRSREKYFVTFNPRGYLKRK